MNEKHFFDKNLVNLINFLNFFVFLLKKVTKTLASIDFV